MFANHGVSLYDPIEDCFCVSPHNTLRYFDHTNMESQTYQQKKPKGRNLVMRQANKPDSPDSHSFNLGIYRPRQLWTSGHVLACPVQMDRVGKVGVSEANRDGFEGKRPSP